MLQQTALMMIAGLILLSFFTPGHEEVHTVSLALTIPLLVTFTLMPGLLSYFLGRRAIRHLVDDRDKQIRQLQNSRRYTLLFGIVVVVGYGFEVYYLKLPTLVNRAFAFLTFENSRMLIGIVPLVIAILLTRLATFELDRQVRNTSWNRRRFLTLNLKFMILPLSPFIIYLFIGDLIDHSPISVRVLFISHSYIYWVIMLGIIMIMYIQAPSIIRRVWVTRPLPDGEIRDRIESLAQRENIKYRDILIWSTAGGKIANAGMAGLLPALRYIFLTDSLLDNFTIDEIETVAAHEFGHIKYKHTMAYLAITFGYMLFYVLLYVRFLPIVERLNFNTTSIALLSAVVTLLMFYVYFIFIFRFLSRIFERQADLYALDSTGKPEVFKDALIKLAAINYTPRRLPRLVELVRTHPSVSRRLEFVDRAVRADPGISKYRRPIFHAGWMSILVLVALLLLFIANKEALLPPGEIHYELGRQYAIEGMIDEAIIEFSEAARVGPHTEQAHYALGVLYNEKGLVRKAVQELRKSLAINPKYAAAREKLKKIRGAE